MEELLMQTFYDMDMEIQYMVNKTAEELAKDPCFAKKAIEAATEDELEEAEAIAEEDTEQEIAEALIRNCLEDRYVD